MPGPSKRQRGEIEKLPSGSLRVRVYAGLDALSGKRNYLVETVPAGPKAAAEAEKVRDLLASSLGSVGLSLRMDLARPRSIRAATHRVP
jgi:hypothetical protein